MFGKIVTVIYSEYIKFNVDYIVLFQANESPTDTIIRKPIKLNLNIRVSERVNIGNSTNTHLSHRENIEL